jgi:hypothetical protein
MKRVYIPILICICMIGFTVGRVAAQPATPLPPDPLQDPAASVGIVEKLFRSGAITSALIVAAFMVLVVLRARVSWFSQGWRAVWCSAALGGLSLLVDSIQSGLTPNISMLIVAGTTTAALAMKPKPVTP